MWSQLKIMIYIQFHAWPVAGTAAAAQGLFVAGASVSLLKCIQLQT